MTPTISKVFAYITHQNRLLVFRHTDFPQAGIQVPAGTVKTNEDLEAAVLREAQEETGLHDLAIKTYLGEQIRNMKDIGKDEIFCREFTRIFTKGLKNSCPFAKPVLTARQGVSKGSWLRF